ncbi:MAG: TIM barrel protein, partial [archaeon GB-1867-035]|nr:TIM barrel protein [Candidatus Culexmicrobium profundum]
MNRKLRFGPAGKPLKYKGKSEEVPRFLHELGLDAYEYQAVRGVKISEDKAKTLAQFAKEFDVELSLHAPYYINLCSTKESVIVSSVQRLVASMKAAKLMNASVVVFHPGYYGSLSPEEALSVCISSMNKVIEYAKSEGVSNVYLSPETMGKIKQLGSLDEILSLCESVENTIPTIDWAHLHARGKGAIKTKDDYLKVLCEIEKRLGSEVVKSLHMHFTKVSFSDSGE